MDNNINNFCKKFDSIAKKFFIDKLEKDDFYNWKSGNIKKKDMNLIKYIKNIILGSPMYRNKVIILDSNPQTYVHFLIEEIKTLDYNFQEKDYSLDFSSDINIQNMLTFEEFSMTRLR